jgi:hypothetical protein
MLLVVDGIVFAPAAVVESGGAKGWARGFGCIVINGTSRLGGDCDSSPVVFSPADSKGEVWLESRDSLYSRLSEVWWNQAPKIRRIATIPDPQPQLQSAAGSP